MAASTRRGPRSPSRCPVPREAAACGSLPGPANPRTAGDARFNRRGRNPAASPSARLRPRRRRRPRPGCWRCRGCSPPPTAGGRRAGRGAAGSGAGGGTGDGGRDGTGPGTHGTGGARQGESPRLLKGPSARDQPRGRGSSDGSGCAPPAAPCPWRDPSRDASPAASPHTPPPHTHTLPPICGSARGRALEARQRPAPEAARAPAAAISPRAEADPGERRLGSGFHACPLLVEGRGRAPWLQGWARLPSAPGRCRRSTVSSLPEAAWLPRLLRVSSCCRGA